jgi:fatty acid desaturase
MRKQSPISANLPAAWITQAEYAKELRPLLPPEAFKASKDRILILAINLAILLCGWIMAKHLNQWEWQFLWLYLPFAILMGNSVIALLFSTHDLMHSNAIKRPFLRRLASVLGLAMLWMPPTLWLAVHNREHHNKTNSIQDPDRNYLFHQAASWGKWIQNLFVPSVEVHPFWLGVGMSSAWGVHTFRNLSSVLLFNDGSTRYPVFSFTVSKRERRSIAVELLAIAAIHIGIVSYLGLHPASLLLGYFLPIWIGYAGLMFYIYTNHMLCQLTPVNDPLINSLSLRVPKIFDLLHLNFSFHTEHHIFPGLNSDFYPKVQELLLGLHPDRYNLLDAGKAWELMLATPRHHMDNTTFVTSSGSVSMRCPLTIEKLPGNPEGLSSSLAAGH